MSASEVVGSRRTSRAAAGFATPEALTGVLLALLAIAGALAAARGLQKLSAVAMAGAEQSVAASWALERIAREVSRAGLGVCPDRDPACPDEALEFIDAAALAVRGDLDGDDPAAALDPERLLTGRFPLVPTGNDEVVVYLMRPAGRGTARPVAFDADLDSSDRVTLPDGAQVARRDGVVESIDAGTAASADTVGGGVLYRVIFTSDARYAGTARFRVSEPLLDGVALFRVEGRDAAGIPVPPCGGRDDPGARACRAAVRRIVLDLAVADVTGRSRRAHREIQLPCAPPAS